MMNSWAEINQFEKNKRIFEWVSMVVGLLLMFINGLCIVIFFHEFGTYLNAIINGLYGIISADFISGLAHWTADTWGSADIPVIGEYFIKSFREHHLDPTSITRHSFIETNAYNFLLIIPLLINMVWKFFSKNKEEMRLELSWLLYVYMLSILLAFTNQIHKWSHTYFNLPKSVLFLQKYRLILSQKEHRYHHIAPHETYYCITTGWLNCPLERLHFWSHLECLISKITGYKPRTDDLRWQRNFEKL